MTGGAFTAGARNFIQKTNCPVVEKPFNLKRIRALVTALVNSETPR